MLLEFNNPTENKVYEEIIKPYCTEESFEFLTNDPYFLYKKIVQNLIKKRQVRVLKNVPKNHGRFTHTEMVLITALGFLWRIDCKFQQNKYSHITIDNIRGEIDRNTVDHNLYEDRLIFVVDGEGIDWIELKKYRKKLPDRIKIFSIKEFKKFLKNNIN